MFWVRSETILFKDAYSKGRRNELLWRKRIGPTNYKTVAEETKPRWTSWRSSYWYGHTTRRRLETGRGLNTPSWIEWLEMVEDWMNGDKSFPSTLTTVPFQSSKSLNLHRCHMCLSVFSWLETTEKSDQISLFFYPYLQRLKKVDIGRSDMKGDYTKISFDRDTMTKD